jgi:hypothetical protein
METQKMKEEGRNMKYRESTKRVCDNARRIIASTGRKGEDFNRVHP